jgi:HlyD family secretion protein
MGAIVGIRSSRTAPATISVTRGSLSQVVSVTGRVKAVQEVDLAFQNSGRVARVDAKIGARVVSGQLLASLNTADLNAQLREAQANVLGQEAKLRNIESGGRAEEIAIKESALRAAQQSLENAYANVLDVLSDAYTKTDNAMRIQLLPVFNSYGSEASPLFTLTFSCQCDVQSRAATTYRTAAEVGLNRWKQELADLSANGSPEAYLSAIRNARGYMQSAKDTISAVGAVLNEVTVSISTTTVESYRTSTSTARASVVAAATSVNTQDQLISSSLLTVERVKGELALTKAGSTPEEIDAQRAVVMSAKAQVDGIQAQISKSIIVSPIAGVVTKQDAKVGQTATANQTLVGVISDQQLEIEANVPEVDIGKVMTGDVVRVTVDALPGETMLAKVSFIDPAETIIDGVVNFRVIMLFDVLNEQLKSGLTVNLEIETIKKDDVLILPQFAIVENDEGTFVRKPDGAQVAVSLGIRSKEGMVEVLSGLSEGDAVLNIGLKSAQ